MKALTITVKFTLPVLTERRFFKRDRST